MHIMYIVFVIVHVHTVTNMGGGKGGKGGSIRIFFFFGSNLRLALMIINHAFMSRLGLGFVFKFTKSHFKKAGKRKRGKFKKKKKNE